VERVACRQMRRLHFSGYAVTVCIAMLTACGGSQPPIGAPGAMPPVASQSREIVKSSSVTATYKVWVGAASRPPPSHRTVRTVRYTARHQT
jgi:hypothetical protein